MPKVRKKEKSQYIQIEWHDEMLTKALNELVGSVRNEIIQKATTKVASKLAELEKTAFSSKASPQAVEDIIISPKRRHAKSQSLDPKGLYWDKSFNNRDAVVSISPKYSDFRLHFFESGTKPRQTRKGENRGAMKAQPFFWPEYNSKAPMLSDMLAKEINELMKKD